MSNAEIIKNFLKNNNGDKFCDDCLAEITGVKPRQQVNQITRPLKGTGNFDRDLGQCKRCNKTKEVTWAK